MRFGRYADGPVFAPGVRDLDVGMETDGNGHGIGAQIFNARPNFKHAVVQPLGAHTLAAILKSWKGFTGGDAKRRLMRTGVFWQAEYYDHLIRDTSDFAHSVRYVLENPSRAGLLDWPWVWASDEAQAVARVS